MHRKLVIIGGLILGLGFGIINLQTTHHGANSDQLGLRYYKHQTSVIASVLRAYNDSHSHYPTNDEGLSTVIDSVKSKIEDNNRHNRFTRCRITPSGVLSWWGDPIIYENRKGQPSGMSSDQQDPHWYKVDEGIYLWSVGEEEASLRWNEQNLHHNIIMITSFLISAVLLARFTLLNLRGHENDAWYKRGIRAATICLYGSLLILLIAVPMQLLMTGCGCWGRQQRRTPELTQKYTSVMRTYRDHGIISKETFDKRIRALKLDEKDEDYRRYTGR